MTAVAHSGYVRGCLAMLVAERNPDIGAPREMDTREPRRPHDFWVPDIADADWRRFRTNTGRCSTTSSEFR